jgi:hypothetical protein
MAHDGLQHSMARGSLAELLMACSAMAGSIRMRMARTGADGPPHTTWVGQQQQD